MMYYLILRKTLFTFLCLLAASTLALDQNNDSMNASVNVHVDEIDRSVNDFNQAWEIRNFPAALTKAEKVVVLLENSDQRQSMNHAIALHNLANAQRTQGWLRQSEKNYRKSIQLIEQRQGSFGTQLPIVLNDLGSLYYEDSNYEFAMDVFGRAQHITHRTDGVYTLKQLKFVDWITLIELKMTRTKDADKQQRFYYAINARNYGEDDPRMLPAMHKMGDWFHRTGQLISALKIYEKTLSVIEKHELNEVEKLQPLRGISSVTYLKGDCCAEEQLDEVLDIISRDPNSDLVDEFDALLHLADTHIVKKKGDKAEQYYRQAWNRIGTQNVVAQELFGVPELLGINRVEDVYEAYYRTVRGSARMQKTIYLAPKSRQGALSFSFGGKSKTPIVPVIGEPLPLCHLKALELSRADDADELEEYFVDVDFTVRRDGSVSNVSLEDSNAPTKLQKYVTNMLRYSRYRPKRRDGEAVDADNIKLRQTFSGGEAVRSPRSSFNRISADGARTVSLGCQTLAMRG